MSEDDLDAVRQFCGYGYPTLVPVDDEYWKRGWVIRTKRPILDGLQASHDIERGAKEVITEALGERYADETLERGFPKVETLVVGPEHAIVWTITRHPEPLGADIAIAGLIAVLRGFDESFGSEEVQGLPKKFWVFFFPAHEDLGTADLENG